MRTRCQERSHTYISRSNYIVAEIAPEATSIRRCSARPVSHHEESIEPKGCIYNNLGKYTTSVTVLVSVKNVNKTLFLEAPSTVGSQRLSRESMRRKITSCESIRPSSFTTSALVCSTELGGTGWPGIGMEREWPVAFYIPTYQQQASRR